MPQLWCRCCSRHQSLWYSLDVEFLLDNLLLLSAREGIPLSLRCIRNMLVCARA